MLVNRIEQVKDPRRVIGSENRKVFLCRLAQSTKSVHKQVEGEVWGAGRHICAAYLLMVMCRCTERDAVAVDLHNRGHSSLNYWLAVTLHERKRNAMNVKIGPCTESLHSNIAGM